MSPKDRKLYSILLRHADDKGIVDGLSRVALGREVGCIPTAVASILGRLRDEKLIRMLHKGTDDLIGRYLILDLAQAPPAPEPERPFSSPDLAELGIEVVTHIRPAFFSFTSNARPEMIAVSLPRLRCLERPPC